MQPLVRIDNLTVTFSTRTGVGYALSDINATIARDRITAIIGESGSGKSVLGAAIAGLLPSNAKLSGTITFDDIELTSLDQHQWDRIRGHKIAWIAQNPRSALGNHYSCAELIAEAAIHQRKIARKNKYPFAHRLLSRVALDHTIAKKYSFELSGGMAQRVLIASGLGLAAPLLILDEPTKGLDPSNLGRIRDIICDLAAKGHTLVVITHDLSLASDIADDIWVFYASRLIEQTSGKEFFSHPYHPYSQGLIAAHPRHGLHRIPGEAPSFFVQPRGCPFANRCSIKDEQCISCDELICTPDGAVMCPKC